MPLHEVPPPPFACDKPNQVGAVLIGFAATVPRVCRTCLCNAVGALRLRHAVAQRRPTNNTAMYLAIATSLTHNLVFGLCLTTYMDPKNDTWMLRWNRAKRYMFEMSMKHDIPNAKVVSGFVKFEMITKAVYVPRPRLIQTYVKLITQALFAREFKALSDALFSPSRYFWEVVPGITITFSCGMDLDDVGEWLTTAICRHPVDTWYLEDDFSAYDSSITREHQVIKDVLYRLVPGLIEHAEETIDVTGYLGRGEKLRYKVKGTTKSGLNDTTLGNSLINAVVKATAMLDQNLRGDIIVTGDDSIIVGNGNISLQRFTDVERDFCLTPEAALFRSVDDITYASMCFIGTPARYYACPKPGRLFARIGWTLRRIGRRRYGDYLCAVASGLEHYYTGSVVMESYFRALKRLLPTTHRKPLTTDVYSARFTTSSARNLSDDLFAIRYGLSLKQWLSLADVFDSIRTPGLISHPILDIVVNFDISGALERTARSP